MKLNAPVFLVVLLMARICCAQEAFPFKGEVNEPDVNVRSDSTIGAPVVCILKKGEHIYVISGAYDWYKIRLPRSAVAYVHKDFILLSDDRSARVLKEKVNVRLRPDTSAPILGQVNKGVIVTVLRNVGDWYKIDPPEGTTGWVNKNFINRVSVVTPVPAPVAAAQSTPAVQENLIVEGLLKRKFFTQVATHKLITDSGEFFLLKGDAKTFDRFLNHKVRVVGIVVHDAASPSVILNVEKVEVLQ